MDGEYYYWCFICKKECYVIETDNGELECEKCKSTFVEELPKNLNTKNQSLLNNPNNSSSQIPNTNLINDLCSSNNNKSQNITDDPLNQPIFLSNQPNEINSNNFSNFTENSNTNNININNNFDDPRNFTPEINRRNINNQNDNISRNFSVRQGNVLVQLQINNGTNTNTFNIDNNFNNNISNSISNIFSNLIGFNNNNNNNNSQNGTGGLFNLNNNFSIFNNFSSNINTFLDRHSNDNAFENLLNLLMINDPNRDRNPCASAQVLKDLKRISLTDENIKEYNETNCSVCLTEYKVKENIIILNCMHVFHDECLMIWLKKRNTCPVCRFELKTDDEDYERRKSQNREALRNYRNNNNDNNGNNSNTG